MNTPSMDYFLELLISSSRTVSLRSSVDFSDPLDQNSDAVIQNGDLFHFLPSEVYTAFETVENKTAFVESLQEVAIFSDMNTLSQVAPSTKELAVLNAPLMAFFHEDELRLIHLEKQRIAFGEHFELRHEHTNTEAFNATLSHDIRSPLSVINICCDYLSSLESDQEFLADSKEFLTRIKNHAQKGLNLAESLLDVFKNNKNNTLNKSVQDISPLLERIAEECMPLAKEKGLNIVTDSVKIDVNIDPDRMSQVIENLIGNAIKFSGSNSNIYLETSIENDHAVLNVRDEGYGIPKHSLDNIFDKYKQLDHKSSRKLGAGLGLSIAQQFVGLHGGHITVDSEEGVGTTFSVHLPIPNKQSSMGTNTVLIVDDDEDIRYYISSILKKNDVKFYSASNGKEAVLEFRKHHPGVVVSDIKMPEMDGFELLEAIKSIDPNTKFIFASGYYPSITDKKAQEIFSASCFLSKPFNERELMDAINAESTKPEITKKAS
ncbi:ATP-binding protein [bacterium]|nr:ATP-binding protein [bacterium]